MDQSTCILFFSRTEVAEAKNKRYSHRLTKQKNQRLANSLISQSTRLIQSTDLPFVHFHEGLQAEGTFGEKLSKAVASVFDSGYSRVIVLGNDCPSLKRSDIFKTVAALDQGKEVLAPTSNGGVYLLGIQKENFDAHSFCNLEWQTEHCYTSILGAKQDFNVEILSIKSDLNDLSTYLESLSTIEKYSFERNFLIEDYIINIIVHNSFAYPTNDLLLPDSFRGPPQCQLGV